MNAQTFVPEKCTKVKSHTQNVPQGIGVPAPKPSPGTPTHHHSSFYGRKHKTHKVMVVSPRSARSQGRLKTVRLKRGSQVPCLHTRTIPMEGSFQVRVCVCTSYGHPITVLSLAVHIGRSRRPLMYPQTWG